MIKYILALAVLAFIKWYGYVEHKAGEYETELFYQKRLAESVISARNEEKEAQHNINLLLQEQFDNVSKINVTLNNRVNELRDRADRMSESSRANCKGATGRELSRLDSGLLEQQFARAERIRTALYVCYRYADALPKKPHQPAPRGDVSY